MAEQPSWQTSTLSQAFIISLGFYMAELLIVTIGLCFFHADVENAKLVIGWSSALEAAISSAYLTARKVNGGTNGTPHAPAAVRETPVAPESH